MIVTGWSNGSPTKSGSGYGLNISLEDREKYFNQDWKEVKIDIHGSGVIVAKITDSFWRKCIELRSSEIGAWMLRLGDAPWPKRKPPRYQLIPTGDGRFSLSK